MGIIEDAKSVVSLVQQIDNIELYKKILDLQGEINNLVGENSLLRKENENLKEQLTIKEALVNRNDAYWIPQQGKEDGPFCTLCWDDKRKLVRLHNSGDDVWYNCNNHEKTISVTPFGKTNQDDYY